MGLWSYGRGAGNPATLCAQGTTPDAVEARLGALHFFDGLPSPDTVNKV